SQLSGICWVGPRHLVYRFGAWRTIWQCWQVLMGDQKIVIWAEACALLEQAERLQRQFFRPYLAGAEPIGWEPPVDVYETDRELRLLAALPGVGQEDLAVSIAAGELVIRGVRRFPVQDPHAVIH